MLPLQDRLRGAESVDIVADNARSHDIKSASDLSAYRPTSMDKRKRRRSSLRSTTTSTSLPPPPPLFMQTKQQPNYTVVGSKWDSAPSMPRRTFVGPTTFELGHSESRWQSMSPTKNTYSGSSKSKLDLPDCVKLSLCMPRRPSRSSAIDFDFDARPSGNGRPRSASFPGSTVDMINKVLKELEISDDDEDDDDVALKAAEEFGALSATA